jgi:LmbE family N-acetylglucosaminyl deacetylase
MKILAVGAHPDDVELGCGATLALFKKRGHEVHVLVLTRGEASGDPALRESECHSSCRALGVDDVIFGNLKDTRIRDDVDTVMAVEEVIKKLNPDIILTHSSKDGHQDHRNASLATLSAARNSKKVLLYESPAALRDFCPQLFIDVGSTFDLKLEALGFYGSQASKVYFRGNTAGADRERLVQIGESRKFPFVSNAIEGLARYRGFQVGVALAEAFEVGKFVLDVQSGRDTLLPL